MFTGMHHVSSAKITGGSDQLGVVYTIEVGLTSTKNLGLKSAEWGDLRKMMR